MELFKIINKCSKELRGLYLISDYGRVFSLQQNKFIKPVSNGYRYYYICLRKNNIKQKIYIHRLVALHFLENKGNKPFINHKDCNPRNNHVSNLEWCTHKENMEYAQKLGHFKKNKEWINKIKEAKDKKPIVCIDKITGELQYFESINSVKDFGYQPSCVCCCCEKKRKSHKGKYWEYFKR